LIYYHQHKACTTPSNDANWQEKTGTATSRIQEATEEEGCARGASGTDHVRVVDCLVPQPLNACCRVTWSDELCEKMLSIIIEDDKLHHGLFPGPGTTQDGTGSNKQPKSEFEWVIARRLFENDEKYAGLFGQSTTTAKGRSHWVIKVKNKLTQ
jgi:hypothetical protein